MKLLPLLVTLAGCAIAVFSQDAGMIAADAALMRAVAGADQSALANLLDADFTWTSAAGVVQTKAQVLREAPRMAITTPDNPASKAFTYGELGIVRLIRQEHIYSECG
jgi:hypothetical protein